MTPAELAQQVRLLEITTRHLVTEVFAGEYSSAFKGRGIEFADVREYQPGDDIRSIDWNVTARTARPFVKRFHEERELTLLLCVDLSASGDFSTQAKSKQQIAAEVAAIIAFAASRSNDRVGLLIFTDQIELFIPPAKGSRHVLRMIRELLAFRPRGRLTDFTVAATRVAHTLKRRAVVFVISDFLVPEPAEAWRQVALRHDVVAVHTLDPRESELVPAGVVNLRDPETGRSIPVDTSSAKVRAAFRDAARRWQDELVSSLHRLRVDLISLRTDKPYIHELVKYFRFRESHGR